MRFKVVDRSIKPNTSSFFSQSFTHHTPGISGKRSGRQLPKTGKTGPRLALAKVTSPYHSFTMICSEVKTPPDASFTASLPIHHSNLSSVFGGRSSLDDGWGGIQAGPHSLWLRFQTYIVHDS
jgi:hypothetical protein